eukprot:4386414-Prorocentrum_lima.AAC.1
MESKLPETYQGPDAHKYTEMCGKENSIDLWGCLKERIDAHQFSIDHVWEAIGKLRAGKQKVHMVALRRFTPLT